MDQHDITAPDVRVHYVRVTNHGDVPFTDRHDGVPICLNPGKSDNFPLDMAAHFFGDISNRDAMFRHVCRRQGWNTPRHLEVQKSGKTLAEENFAKLEIKPAVYKMVEVEPDLDKPIPAEPHPQAEEAAEPPRRGPGRPPKPRED